MDINFQKQGIPQTYWDEFESQCDGKTSWNENKINHMCRPVDWIAM